jgi:peptidoglycan/xylan/chitin deacetylase (PgdA/CDA1 family)
MGGVPNMLTIIPTIDTEGVHGRDPFRQMVLGELEGETESWGIYQLSRIFKQNNVPATFFVDVYESSLWGESPLREACVRLTDEGFDVELHTHPGWRDDPHDFDWIRQHKSTNSYLAQHKDFMVKLSLQEQIKLIREGMDMLEAWTGRRPIAHRSGGYSVNSDTIKALQECGIPLDSSMYWGHPNYHLAWTKNSVKESNGIIEIPVTLIDYVFALPFAGEIYRKSMKTDLDTCSLDELLAYVKQGIDGGLRIMNLFMHSYSLLSFDADYKRFKPEIKDFNKLNNFLTEINRMNGVRVMDCRRFLEEYKKSPEYFIGPDIIPQISVNTKIAKLAIKKTINIGHEIVRRKIRVGN